MISLLAYLMGLDLIWNKMYVESAFFFAISAIFAGQVYMGGI